MATAAICDRCFLPLWNDYSRTPAAICTCKIQETQRITRPFLNELPPTVEGTFIKLDCTIDWQLYARALESYINHLEEIKNE